MKIQRAIIIFMLILSLGFSMTACGNLTSFAEVSSVESTQTNMSSTETTIKEETAYEVTYSSAKTYKNSIGTVWVQIIFEVENTGTTELYLSSGSCDLEDSTGKLVASETMISVYPQVISPGEKAYYYEETTLDGVTNTPELTVIARPDVEKAKVSKQELAVSEVELQDSTYYGIKALGRVENTLTEEASMIYVAVVLFDSQNKPTGLLFTILMEDLASGSKIGFEASALSMPDDITTSSVASFKAFAYDFQYQF